MLTGRCVVQGDAIESAERAFFAWRRNGRGGRIPDRLWSLATDLVRREGLPYTRVSKRLRLDPRALKQRLPEGKLWGEGPEGAQSGVTAGAAMFAESSLAQGGPVHRLVRSSSASQPGRKMKRDDCAVAVLTRHVNRSSELRRDDMVNDG